MANQEQQFCSSQSGFLLDDILIPPYKDETKLLAQGSTSARDYNNNQQPWTELFQHTHAAQSSGTAASGQNTPAQSYGTNDSEYNQSPCTDKASKKRQNDQAYRGRLKQKRIESETNMTTLLNKSNSLEFQNWKLNFENEFLKKEKAFNEKLINQLRSELYRSELGFRVEIEKLKFEIALLKHNAKLNDRVSQLEMRIQGSNLTSQQPGQTPPL